MTDIKKSNFSASTAVTDTDYFDFVRNGTNIKVSFADVKASIGITVSLNGVGSPLGNPTMYQQTSTSYAFRAIESGSGVLAQISPLNGIEVGLNLTQDATGSAVFDDVGATKPTVASFTAGQGISITKTLNAIEISNTVDPATGLSNRVVVTQASDLSGTLDGTKEYFIDGIVDMGSQSIEVPQTGLNLTGYNFDVSKLISSATSYTMFTSPAGGSGNVLGKDYAIEVTGASSQVYNITSDTGAEAFEFSRVNYNDCTSLGTIAAYRQGLEVGSGRFGGTPELTLAGTWTGGYFIDTSIVRSLTDGAYTLFKAGAAFTMASRFRTNQNIDLPASASFIDFATANMVNPSTLQLDGCIITRAGVTDPTDTNILPNIDHTDIKSRFVDNIGIVNTFEGGESEVTAEIATTISVINTYVDLAGTYTASELQHFDAPSNGQLRHIGNDPREYKIVVDASIVGTASDVIGLKIVKWDNSASGFVDVTSQSRQINNLVGGRNVGFFTILVNAELDQNDYIKLQVNNQTGTDNVTAELTTFFTVEKR